MIIAIDESGSFAAGSTDRHFFAAAHIRQRKTLYKLKRQQFLSWESDLPRTLKNSKGEIKGSALSDEQLAEFARHVVCSTYQVGITPYAIRPAENPVAIVEKHRTVIVRSIEAGHDLYSKQGKDDLARTFNEFANWVRKLSYAQILKIKVLGECIVAALVNSVGHSISGNYDYELPNLRFLIDRDFVREPRPDLFWHELLRNQLWRATKSNPIPVLRKWEKEDHPFLDKFWRDGDFDFNDLFWKECSFVHSHERFEVRIADLINTILARYYNHKRCQEAFHLVRRCFLYHGRITQLILDDFSLAEWRYDPTGGPFTNDPKIRA
jgi:hypothetical protein